MIGTHITADNREIPIICLKDSHLINIIKMRIVKPFDLYESSLKVSPKLSFHLGKNVRTIEKPDVRKLITNSIYYISEALRRDATRQSMLEVLGKLDEDFGVPERFDVSEEEIISVKLLENSNDWKWESVPTDNDDY